MKFRLLLLAAFVALCPAASRAQEPSPTPEAEEYQTRLETLLEKTGAVLVKGFTAVGSVTGLRGTASVTSWEVFDAGAGRREYGVGVEIRDAARAERGETGDLAYVDYDELAALIGGLNYLLKLDNSATGLTRFEAQYRTRGYLSVFRFNTPNGFGAAVSASGRRGPRLILRPTGLVEFRDLLESAKAAIDEAREKR